MLIRQGEAVYQDPETIRRFLEPCGITWERWEAILGLEGSLKEALGPGAYPEVVAQIKAPLEALKAERGYRSEDIVALSPETPNLAEILAPFAKTHHHTDDEVRAILAGDGIFGVEPVDGEPFEIHVSAGDALVVPAYTRHWFTLADSGHIVALRIFKDKAGWEAVYEPISSVSSSVS